jgi:hypothetical protein
MGATVPVGHSLEATRNVRWVQGLPEPIPALTRSCDGSPGSLSQNARRALPLHHLRGPAPSMNNSVSATSLALLTGASCLAMLLLDQPAHAHGIAQGGVDAGFLHPITGADHLMLLISVVAAASCISSQLLLWALAGAIGGGVFAPRRSTAHAAASRPAQPSGAPYWGQGGARSSRESGHWLKASGQR